MFGEDTDADVRGFNALGKRKGPEFPGNATDNILVSENSPLSDQVVTNTRLREH